MQVAKNTVVSLRYQLFDQSGQMIEETGGDRSFDYLHGGYDGIFPLVEEALQDKHIGETITIDMKPEDAFGERDPGLIKAESIEHFPPDVAVGMMFEGYENDEDESIFFVVTEIAGKRVIIDANHPLAGKNLRFVATVKGIRQASHEEVEHGHVHSKECANDD